MIIYGSTMSPFVRKLVAYTLEKGIEAEVRPVGIGDPDPQFRAASPLGKMPALVDGDFGLSDSSAIIHYLEARFPDPALIPTEPEARGRTIWFEEFADTVLISCGSKMFFNRIVAPIFLKRDGDEAIAAAAERDELPRILDYLEGVAPDGDSYLVGDRLTIADLAVASPFVNLRHLKVAIDRNRYPQLRAYVDRILDRPSFAASLARETAFLQKVAA